jgi:hypothetical protein
MSSYYQCDWTALKKMIKRRRALFAYIREAYDGVSREGGVSLHELNVIDGYGGSEERRQARSLDIDATWTEVPDDHIRRLAQGWVFFDSIGFRYYLPAFMCFELRYFYREKQSMINAGVEGMLQSNNQQMFTLFNEKQRACILSYLEFVRDYCDTFGEAKKSIDRYWSKRPHHEC